MSKHLAIVFAVCLCISALLHQALAGGDKGGGSNIILQDKHSQIVLNSGGKKGGDNIVIRDKGCCHHKKIKYVYVPVFEHWGHLGHVHGGHSGWGHEKQSHHGWWGF